jgi:hypothetical protein
MGSHCSGVWHFETDSLVLFVFYELVFFYAIGNVLLLLLLLLLLKRQCVPAFIRMWIAGVSCKLFSWRSVECGVLKEVIGKVVIFCMKCLSTILASYTLKNAMQMIHMLERLLGVSVCQQFCEIVKLFPCSEIMQLCWSSQYVCICILCIQMCKIPLILCCFFVRTGSHQIARGHHLWILIQIFYWPSCCVGRCLQSFAWKWALWWELCSWQCSYNYCSFDIQSNYAFLTVLMACIISKALPAITGVMLFLDHFTNFSTILQIITLILECYSVMIISSSFFFLLFKCL